MREWRKLASGACVALVVAACVGSASASASTSTRRAHAAAGNNIAFACATSSIPFFAPIVKGASDAARAMGVKVNYTGITSASITGPAMATVLTAAVAQHPAALVVCNFFPSAEDPIIKQAVKSGIPVFVTDAISDWQGDGALNSYDESNKPAGVAAGKAMIAAGVKHPLCVDDTPTNPDVALRCTGFAAAFKAKGIKAITLNLPPSASNNPTEILADTKGELESHRNIDGALALGNIQGGAVVQAVAAAGRTGKIKVGTFDVDSNIVSDIKHGSMLFTVWQEPYLQGYLPVVAAALQVKYGMSTQGQTYTGPLVVTKSNVSILATAVKHGLG